MKSMQNKENPERKIYNFLGEHIGYIDIFPEIQKETILSSDDNTKITVFLIPPKCF